MAGARDRTFNAGDVLLASQLNSVQDYFLNNALLVLSPLTGSIDAAGFDITALDELAFNDAAVNASATRRLRANAANLTWHDGTVAGRLFYAGGTDVPVADGGTGLSSGTSGGVLYFSATGTIASSALLTTNRLVRGGGAGAAPVTGILSDDNTNVTLTSGQLLLPNGTDALPALASTTQTNLGLRRLDTDVIVVISGGTQKFAVAGTNVKIRTDTALSWVSGGDLSNAIASDLFLNRAAANILILTNDGSTTNTADLGRATTRVRQIFAGTSGIDSTGPIVSSVQRAFELGPFGTLAGQTGATRFLELAANGTNYVGFKSADALAANVIWTLPTADGTANQTLQTNGSAVLSWAAPLDIGARVFNSANISISNATTTAVTFDSERWDTDTIHSVSVNTSRLTATTAGKYVVIGQVEWDSGTTGFRYAEIFLNGLTRLAVIRQIAVDSSQQVVGTIANLAAADYVELRVHHTQGAALSLIASAQNPDFMMQKIG